MSFTKNLNKLLLIGTVLVGGSMNIESMEQRARKETDGPDWAFFDKQLEIQQMTEKINWISVYDATTETFSHSKNTLMAYSGNQENTNWLELKSEALKGDSLAQFYLYTYLYRMSNQYTNGTREALKRNALMFLLMSYLKGKQSYSKDALTYRMTPTLQTLNTKAPTSEIIKNLQIILDEMMESE